MKLCQFIPSENLLPEIFVCIKSSRRGYILVKGMFSSWTVVARQRDLICGGSVFSDHRLIFSKDFISTFWILFLILLKLKHGKFLATILCTGINYCYGQHGLGITSWNEGHSWSLAPRVALMGHQPSCKAQRYVRSGHKTLSYTGGELNSLLGQSQRQVDWIWTLHTIFHPFSVYPCKLTHVSMSFMRTLFSCCFLFARSFPAY